MASSGSDKPRVPPPPLLRKPSAPPVAPRPPVAQKNEPAEPDVDDVSTAEHAAPTPSAIASPAPTPTFTPPPAEIDGDAEAVDMSARELDVLFDAEGDEPANEPVAKPKHALPRPKPVKSKAAEFASSPLRSDAGTPSRRSTPPPLSGNVPRGVKPPVAGAKRPEDTDVIIAALGAELIDDDEPAAGESVEAPTDMASSAPRVSAASRSFATEGVPLDDDLEPHARKPPWMWIAVGALAAVVIAIVAASWGDDEGEPAAVARADDDGAYSASMSAQNEKDGGQAKPVVAARREAPAVDEAPARADANAPAGAAEPEAEAELAVGEVEEVEEAELADAEAADANAPAEGAPTEPAAVEEAPAPAPAPVAHGGGHGKRNRHRGKHQERSVASAGPAASSSSSSSSTSKAPASSKGEPSADELLASAKKALASGNNASAYALAAKARRLKKTNDGLQVMAKAGCRMGSENKAKAAFSQLPFGMKAGIRSECRAKGIRLGL